MDEYGDRETYALVDAPSINAQGFLEKLYVASGWDDMRRLRAEHHADTNDRTVAAASIVAKSERERLIARLKKDLGCDFGSGYCHDPRTIAHLKTVAPGAAHVRWTWATVRNLLSEAPRGLGFV
jgi:ribonuclease HII